MPQFGVAPFDRIGLALVGQRLMLAGIVNEVGVGWQLVGVVLSGLRRPIEQRLQTLRFPVIGHIVGNDAARRAVYLRDEVDALFFCPAKV